MRLAIDILGHRHEFLAYDSNPYDDGYLLARGTAHGIMHVWKDRPREDDVIREFKAIDDSGWVTALVMEGEISLTFWPSTSDDYNARTGKEDFDGSGHDVYSTAMWPFDFEIEVL